MCLHLHFGTPCNLTFMSEFSEITTYVQEIGRYDAAVLALKAADLYAAGFAPGDLVTVTFPGRQFVMPVGRAYSDVDNRQMILMEIVLDGRMLVTINNGDAFASIYDIHVGDPVTIRMKEKAGYLKEYHLRSCEMSGSRADYASDEIFANFRYVKAGKIAPGRLYRCMSPIDPADSRNLTADALLSETDVKTVINLDGDPGERMDLYPGYKKTWYSRLKLVPAKICYSPANPQFFAGMGTICRAILTEEGPFLIHCRYGRDRTGNVCAVLEALCGASMDEITDDYMLSYENIHHIAHKNEKWLFHAERHVDGFFREILGIKDVCALPQPELTARIRDLLIQKSGMTAAELDGVCRKLCEN